MKFLKEHSLFIFVLLLCAVLRLFPLFDYQFTYDELSGLTRTQFDSFSEVMEKGVKIDAHPAFVQLLIFYTVKIFGYQTWIVKLPFLLFSLGLVIYAYAFGYRNFSKQSGLIASVIFSFSLIFVFYAPIARMYISGAFFSMALLYYFFEIFFNKNLRTLNFFFLGFFAWMSALNQHINSLFAFTVCLSGLFLLDKENTGKYLITCAITVVAYLPHMPVTLYQLSVPGIGRDIGGWLEVPEFSVIFSFLKTLFGTGNSYVVVLLLIASAVAFSGKITFDKKRIFLLLIFIINYLIIYFYSLLRAPVFQYSVMLFASTALIMLVSSWISFEKQMFFIPAFLLLLGVLGYRTYITKDYLHECVKTVFEYQFERTIHYKKLYGDKNVFPVFCDADETAKMIYFGKYNTKFDCVVAKDSMISYMEAVKYKRWDTAQGKEVEVSTVRLFSEFLLKLKCDYLVLTSATPLFQATAAEYFPYLIESTQTQANNFKLYSRRPEDKKRAIGGDRLNYYSTPFKPAAFSYNGRKEPTELPMRIDSLQEFPFGCTVDLDSVCDREGQVIFVRADFETRDSKDQLESCISIADRKSNEAYSYTAKSGADFVRRNDSTLTLITDLFVGTKFKEAHGKANLNCYLWNRGKESMTLSNYEIMVINYWQNKWHFWD